MKLLFWQQCKVQLTDTYVSLIMSIPYWTVEFTWKRIRQKTNSLIRQEEDVLWECGLTGSKTPKNIIPPKTNKTIIWWQITQHFKLQERKEHHSMRVVDVTFCKDGTEAPYVVFAQGITKTRESDQQKKAGYSCQKCLKHNLKSVL